MKKHMFLINAKLRAESIIRFGLDNFLIVSADRGDTCLLILAYGHLFSYLKALLSNTLIINPGHMTQIAFSDGIYLHMPEPVTPSVFSFVILPFK